MAFRCRVMAAPASGRRQADPAGGTPAASGGAVSGVFARGDTDGGSRRISTQVARPVSTRESGHNVRNGEESRAEEGSSSRFMPAFLELRSGNYYHQSGPQDRPF